jgi:hypothetical protein
VLVHRYVRVGTRTSVVVLESRRKHSLVKKEFEGSGVTETKRINRSVEIESVNSLVAQQNLEANTKPKIN